MLLVIGGGRDGTYHARQLLRARAEGAVQRALTVAVVDHSSRCRAFVDLHGEDGFVPVLADWSEFLDAWLAGGARDGDHVIPAPWMPHLLWSWLGRATGAAACDAPDGWGLPYEVAGEAGVRYVSAAAWTCPATCVEPAHCPALHAPRDWDLAGMIADRAARLGWIPAVFRSYHLAYGIASVPVSDLLEARQRVLGAPAGARILVATSSHCHAAIGGLRLDRSG